jgi:TP901 family phage tail tape measure protein
VALNALGLGLLFTAKDLASGVIGTVRQHFRGAAQDAETLAKRSKEFSQGIGRVGAGMAVAGAAISAGLGLAVRSSRDFGKAIALVASESDEATFSTEDMRKVSLDLAQQFGKMPVEEAQALYDAVGFGANTASKATSALTAANKLSIAGNTDVKTSLSAVIGTLNAYNASYDKSADVSDAFFKAMTLGKTTVGELAQAFPRVTGQAAGLGISYDTLLAATATLTSRNVKADEAISGLKEALANLAKPSSEAAGEAARLGIKFSAAEVRAKGLPKVLSDIMHNSKFTADTFTKLFGSIEGVNAIQQLTSGNMQTFNDNLAQMKDRSGATDTGFKKMATTLAFSQDKFAAMIEVSKIFVGDILAPMAQHAFQVGAKIVESFNKIPGPIKAMIVKGAALAATILSVGGSVAFLVSKLSMIGETIGMLTGGGGFAGIVAAAWPVVAVIAAITLVYEGFKTAIDKNVGGIGDKLRSLWDNVKLGFNALTQLFTQGGFSGAVREEFLKGQNPIINFAIQVYLWVNRIKNFFSGLVDGFASGIAQINFQPFIEALDAVGAAFGPMTNDTKASGDAFNKFGATGASVGQRIAQVFAIVVNVITVVLDMVAGFVSAWQAVSPAVSELGTAIEELFAPIGDLIGALTGASSSGQSTGATFQSVGHAIAVVFGRLIHTVASSIKSIAAYFSDGIEGIKGVINVFSGVIHGRWSQVWTGLKQIVYSVITSIVDFVFLGVQGIADAIDGVLGTHLGDSVHKAQDTIRTGLKDMMKIQQEATATTAPVTTPVAGSGPTTAAAMSYNMSAYPFAQVLAQQAPQSVDTAPLANAIASGFKQAPPAVIDVTLNVDGETVGKSRNPTGNPFAPQSVME